MTDEGHSVAVRHFGRVVGFLVPLEGRTPKKVRGELGLAPRDVVGLLATMAYAHGLLKQSGPCWELTPYGVRHLDGL